MEGRLGAGGVREAVPGEEGIQDSERRRTPRTTAAAPSPTSTDDETDRRDLDRIKRRIERCLQKEQRSTLARLELGRLLADVHDRGLWRIDKAEGMSAWLRGRYQIDAPQARKYKKVGPWAPVSPYRRLARRSATCGPAGPRGDSGSSSDPGKACGRHRSMC